MVQKGAVDLMAMRESDRMIANDESVVNMGENKKKANMKERNRMNHEIVDPNLGPGTKNIKKGELLPKFEESKQEKGPARARYDAFTEEEELKDGCVLPASLLNS